MPATRISVVTARKNSRAAHAIVIGLALLSHHNHHHKRQDKLHGYSTTCSQHRQKRRNEGKQIAKKRRKLVLLRESANGLHESRLPPAGGAHTCSKALCGAEKGKKITFACTSLSHCAPRNGPAVHVGSPQAPGSERFSNFGRFADVRAARRKVIR